MKTDFQIAPITAKEALGLTISETERGISFCGYTIMTANMFQARETQFVRVACPVGAFVPCLLSVAAAYWPDRWRDFLSSLCQPVQLAKTLVVACKL